MIKFTYIPEFAEEYTPVREINMTLNEDVAWRDLIDPINNFLSAVSYIPPYPHDGEYRFIKAVDDE